MGHVKNTPCALTDRERLAKAEAIWDMVVREAAERKLGEAGLGPADVLRLLETHEKDLLYEVETLDNEFFRDFTIQAWQAAGEALKGGISSGRPHREAYPDAMKLFFTEYATRVMRLRDEWERSPDKSRDFWKLEVQARPSWTWATYLKLESDPQKAELEKKFGTIDERVRRIGHAYERISARSGVEPLCVAHCLRGVAVVLMPHLAVKLMELGYEKSGGKGNRMDKISKSAPSASSRYMSENKTV